MFFFFCACNVCSFSFPYFQSLPYVLRIMIITRYGNKYRQSVRRYVRVCVCMMCVSSEIWLSSVILFYPNSSRLLFFSISPDFASPHYPHKVHPIQRLITITRSCSCRGAPRLSIHRCQRTVGNIARYSLFLVTLCSSVLYYISFFGS